MGGKKIAAESLTRLPIKKFSVNQKMQEAAGMRPNKKAANIAACGFETLSISD